MTLPTLLQDGDAIERATWPFLKDFFPHYEKFWQIHIVPLRCTGSIHPRRGINEDFEFLAMQHYSLYVNLGKAYARILGPEAPTNYYEFPDEVYVVLQHVAELALKVVDRFQGISRKCTGQTISVDTLKIKKLIERIGGYRNLIHQELLGIRADPSGRLLVYRPEKLEKYAKWTAVLYDASAEDFIDVHTQLVDDFHALCSALETTWKILCARSTQLTANKVYREKQAEGEAVPVLSMSRGVSGAFVVSSNAVSNAVASPVVGSIIMLHKPGE